MDDDIRKRLEQHLRMAVFRLRRIGGAVAVKELFGAIGDSSSLADEVDVIQANESREIGFATRELLLERVNRLSEALDRLNRGEYGICAECGEPISRARLHAMPEVQTCVRCQDEIEHGQFERKGTEPRFYERVTLPPSPLPARLP